VREHVNIDRLVELTQALVSVGTSNPPGNEAPLRDLCHEALARWQPSWTEVEPEPNRLSLVARLPSRGGVPGPRAGKSGTGSGHARPTLIVNGHLDVVPALAASWAHDPFSPVVSEGRLYGRGTADMKGGVAAAICALDALEAAGCEPACDIVFHLVADEERGGALGTRALLDGGFLLGDACLVPEPTSLAVCVAERGLLQGYITIRGRPAHGSRPREGVSAVEQAAHVVIALHAADFGDPAHPLLGTPTANIGTLQGGSTFNVVAEQARIGFDRRLLPGVGLEDALTVLRQRIEAAGVEGLDYDIEVADFGEGSEMSANHPFAELARRAVASVTGSVPETIGMTFTTDARFLRNQAGIPAVVCGPGDIAQAHGVDEWVSIDQLADATAAYAELYRSFGPGTLGSPADVASV
jgi:acetylornithine deacetylase/succinyl-diaminopimelate desuccinylase